MTISEPRSAAEAASDQLDGPATRTRKYVFKVGDDRERAHDD